MPATDRILSPYATRACFILLTALLLHLATIVGAAMSFGPNVGMVVMLALLLSVLMVLVGVAVLIVSLLKREPASHYTWAAVVLLVVLAGVIFYEFSYASVASW